MKKPMKGDGEAEPPAALFPKHLELFEDNCQLVSLTFGLTLYTNARFTSVPGTVLGSYEKFLALCPADRLKFYKTDTMSRHKEVNARVMGMLGVWLKPDAPEREDIHLELKDGRIYQDAPRFAFEACGCEEGSVGYGEDANMIKMTFPPEWGLEKTGEMLSLATQLCTIFPFRAGSAGFAFECSPYNEEESHAHAWRTSMRHRGIDISRIPEDAGAVGQDALKGVNWLTLLGSDFVTKLGGIGPIRKKLSREVEMIEVGKGLVLKAGAAPSIGDINRRDDLVLYREVYRLVAPLVEPAIERTASFNLDGEDYVEKTEEWYRRFAGE